MQQKWGDLLFDAVRSRLLGPKDIFERFKRRSVVFLTAIITCAFIAPKFFGALTATFGTGVGQSLDLDVLVGISPDDVTSTVILAAILVSLGGFLIFSNLSYAKFIRNNQNAIREEIVIQQRDESFADFRARVLQIQSNADSNQTKHLLEHIKSTFPDLYALDAELVQLDYAMNHAREGDNPKLLPKPEQNLIGP
jgi:hypothetical protein